MIGEAEGHRRVLLHDQHADLLLFIHGAQDLEQLPDDERREAERGLVEQHEARPQHQRARHREHLLLAARERARLLRPTLPQPRKIFEDALQVLLDRRAVLARIGAEPQVLLV